MSSPVPLLRPPVPGARNNNGSPRAPKLTLGIPPHLTPNPSTAMPPPLKYLKSKPNPNPSLARPVDQHHPDCISRLPWAASRMYPSQPSCQTVDQPRPH
ncbi:hypothetical protein N7517_003085 [Penicillium concentricum]|uniref:Uncharacterized protein n=1 Tax=Penicillium concentricum TaxID=293559 RepID=A0A9W9SX24_9EURO|nr:uncharacterized protein N7517_003085 [Penicillium concentricum]KAJ5385174.1 hypothetical protein N7517_003085 [Penicillium concentricum]